MRRRTQQRIVAPLPALWQYAGSSSGAGAISSAAARRRRRLVTLVAHPVGGALVIGAICSVAFVVRLGASHLWDPGEGRHAEIARELLARGQWLTLTLNGNPYHDKPVFSYWLVAAALQAFGAQEWAARLPSAAGACIGVIATAWVAARLLDPLTGTLAGIILATTGMYLALGRFATLDMTFALWITLAFFYGAAWCLVWRHRGRSPWPFYLLLALATLTKGPAALVLAGLTFAPFAARLGLSLRELRVGSGLLLIGLVAGSWYVAAALVAPAYVGDFLWGHNLQRFTSANFGHPHNVFLYCYILPATFLPWSLYWPVALLRARHRGSQPVPLALELCGLWFATTFIFFSLSAAKLPTYMLPAFPPLAVLTAAGLAPVLRRAPVAPGEELAHRFAWSVLGLVCASAPVAAYVYLRVVAPHQAPRALAALLLLPFPFAAWRWIRQRRFDRAVAAVVPLMLLFICGFYGWLSPALNEVYSLRHAATLVRLMPAETRVVTYRAKGYSMSFYLERPLPALRQAVDVGLLLAGSAPAAVLTKPKHVAALRQELRGPVYLWWRNARSRVLISNVAPPADRGLQAEILTPVDAPGASPPRAPSYPPSGH